MRIGSVNLVQNPARPTKPSWTCGGTPGPPRGEAAPRDETRDPLHRLACPLGHHGKGQLAVVIVENLEAVVASIAHFVQGADHLRNLRAVHALAGKDPVVPRGFDAVVGGADI